MVRVSINIKYILYFVYVLHFILLHSAGGATVVRMERNLISHTTYRAHALNVTCFRAVIKGKLKAELMILTIRRLLIHNY